MTVAAELKILHFVLATVSQRKVVAIYSNYLLVADWSEAKNSGCEWFIQLSDNRYPITAFCYRALSDK